MTFPYQEERAVQVPRDRDRDSVPCTGWQGFRVGIEGAGHLNDAGELIVNL